MRKKIFRFNRCQYAPDRWTDEIVPRLPIYADPVQTAQADGLHSSEWMVPVAYGPSTCPNHPGRSSSSVQADHSKTLNKVSAVPLHCSSIQAVHHRGLVSVSTPRTLFVFIRPGLGSSGKPPSTSNFIILLIRTPIHAFLDSKLNNLTRCLQR